MVTHDKRQPGRALPIMCNPQENFRNWGGERCYFLCLLLEGTLSFQLDNREYHLSAPCFLCLRNGQKPEIYRHRGLQAVSVSFNPLFVNPNLSEETIGSSSYTRLCSRFGFPTFQSFFSHDQPFSGVVPLDSNTLRHAELLFRRLYNELHIQSDKKWSCRSRVYLLRLLHLADQHFADSLEEAAQSTCQEERIRQFIQTNYYKPITLDQLCRRFQTNRTTLTRVFKSYTGMTVQEYLTWYRLEVSKEALAFSSLSLKEIAELSGFHYDSYFSKLFSQRVGMPPLKYRLKALQERQEYWKGWAEADRTQDTRD